MCAALCVRRRGTVPAIHAVSCWRLAHQRSSVTPDSLRQEYQTKRNILYKQYADRVVNPRGVFTNSELSLKHITVYGFDYDFTLVQYKPEVTQLIYDKAKTIMVKNLGYPSAIESFEYNPDFPIRGLHLDIRNGLLMKMDTYHHIQLGSVHRGRRLVETREVIDLYGGTHIPLNIMDDHHHHRSTAEGSANLVQFLDSFSLPEVALFADISEFLRCNNILFDPEYLYLDVEQTIRDVHHSGVLYNSIMNDPDSYIKPSPNLLPLLNRLKSAGKKLFLLTNSRFNFVNTGMHYMTNSADWRELFDVIVCAARKPMFYGDVNRPFRSLDQDTFSPTWQRVSELKSGAQCIYHQGNIKEFVNLTGWKGENVLYIGDHVLSDLTDPSLHLGWRTGAIIPELDSEIRKANTSEYKHNLASLMALEILLKEHQGYDNQDLLNVIEEWKKERATVRILLKQHFNPKFGSIFRTEKAATYFSRRLMRFANLYMSSLENLMDFSLDHTFYPRRSSLPHEPDVNFDV